MTSKAMKPRPAAGAPKELTPEEKAAQIARFLAQKREQYITSVLFGLVHNPAITEMVRIRASVTSDGVEHRVIDMSAIVNGAISAGDALLAALYPVTDEKGEKTE